jgi:NAD(P)-dependent dehydrogenase (short-subunit alcohol dehydrogenase family)
VSHQDEDSAKFSVGNQAFKELIIGTKFDGVVWAGGINYNDSVSTFNEEKFLNIVDANLTFNLKTLQMLHNANALRKGASLVFISSIWNQLARQNKLSYSLSKAAISSAIKSIAIDLGEFEIRANSVAPGVLLNEMTFRNLTEVQINKIRTETPLGELTTLDEVSNVVCWLLSPESSGLTGQTIVVDKGWSFSRYV